ncbi:MAG: UDP-N-acetylmuramoyl-L-alanine--D-glutamate ligase [SAR324 cluster bacterium]|nr:UDP-N-acetylmuramoyl-L-alanine--D-glutamate ligase [SAR324 cluster bacterium]
MKDKPVTTPEQSPPDIGKWIGALPRPIALVGFGVEGRETLQFLLNQGVRDIKVFDQALDGSARAGLAEEYPGAGFVGENNWEGALAACGTVFRSPGVRPDHPGLQAAREAGAAITSATALFLSLCPGRVVGVTGTVGKGTTATLIAEALRASGIPCRLAGNIGLNPLAFLGEMKDREVAVLELSSFQLMDLSGRRPDVAVVLRTSSEHLDWHSDAAEYRGAKGGILAPPHHAQTVICCADSEGSLEIATSHGGQPLEVSLAGPVREGVGVAGGNPMRYRGGRGEPLPELEHLSLPGRFNLENAAAAWLAAEALGAQPGRGRKAIAAFPGLPHRLELVGRTGDVDFYNDSYATRPEATLAALSVFSGPLTVILGGSEKHADFGPLCEALCRHGSLRRVLLIGSTAQRLAEEMDAAAARLAISGPPVLRADTLEEAFREGLGALAGGGVLLFSPGCASFDMFPNYKVRGERFRALVEAARETV